MDDNSVAPMVEVHPLTPERWADLEALFGRSGASGGCWCMWWRVPNKAYDGGEGNKAAFRAITSEMCERGQTPGLLAYAGGVPVGWISLGPRADFRRFDNMRADVFNRVDALPVWSVVCFYIGRNWRRKGIAGVLLRHAIDYAREHGATLLEAYPVDVDAEGATANVFMGTQSLFADAGFSEVARRKPSRPIMRLALQELHT